MTVQEKPRGDSPWRMLVGHHYRGEGGDAEGISPDVPQPTVSA